MKTLIKKTSEFATGKYEMLFLGIVNAILSLSAMAMIFNTVSFAN